MEHVFLFQYKIELSQQFEQLQNIRQSNVDEDGNDVTDPVSLKISGLLGSSGPNFIRASLI